MEALMTIRAPHIFWLSMMPLWANAMEKEVAFSYLPMELQVLIDEYVKVEKSNLIKQVFPPVLEIELNKPDGTISGVYFSRDDSQLLIFLRSNDGYYDAEILDSDTGLVKTKFSIPKISDYKWADFSEDGKYVTMCLEIDHFQIQAFIFSIDSSEPLYEITPSLKHNINYIEPQVELAKKSADNSWVLLQIDNHKELFHFPELDGRNASLAHITEDHCNALFTFTGDKEAKLLDCRSGKPIYTFKNIRGLHQIIFSAKKDRFISIRSKPILYFFTSIYKTDLSPKQFLYLDAVVDFIKIDEDKKANFDDFLAVLSKKLLNKKESIESWENEIFNSFPFPHQIILKNHTHRL